MLDLTDILDRYLVAKGEGDPLAWDAKAWAIAENRKMSGKVRAQDRLFVTDLGKCPRAVKYRLTGEPKYPPTTAKRMMFEQAEDLETQVAAACRWAGVLRDYQAPVLILDRENWGGRKDITVNDLGTPLTVEVKSMRSANFKGSKRNELPKPDHVTQANVYEHYDSFPSCLLYADRGGENTPVQIPTPPLDWATISARMDYLDSVRADAGLPDILPLVMSRRSKRRSSVVLGELRLDWSGEIWFGPDWRCNYCDYDRCPGSHRESHLLAKITKAVPITLSGMGESMEEDVYRYIRSCNEVNS